MLTSLVGQTIQKFFGQESVDYLEYIISSEVLSIDPGEVESIKRWEPPQTAKEVHSFIGLTGNYWAFSKFTERLLKKEVFQCTPEAQIAFETLMAKLESTPVLALPNFNHEFQVETEALGKGICAVMYQKGNTIA